MKLLETTVVREAMYKCDRYGLRSQVLSSFADSLSELKRIEYIVRGGGCFVPEGSAPGPGSDWGVQEPEPAASRRAERSNASGSNSKAPISNLRPRQSRTPCARVVIGRHAASARVGPSLLSPSSRCI
jgi:hypothetical protein